MATPITPTLTQVPVYTTLLEKGGGRERVKGRERKRKTSKYKWIPSKIRGRKRKENGVTYKKKKTCLLRDEKLGRKCNMRASKLRANINKGYK